MFRTKTKLAVIAMILLAMIFAASGCTAKPETAITEAAEEATVTEASATEAVAEEEEAAVIENEGKPLRVAFLGVETTHESVQRNWQQFQNEVEGRGWEIAYSDINTGWAADKQRTAFTRAMETNPDAIVPSYLDIPVIADLFVEAQNKGIDVYLVGELPVEGVAGSMTNSEGGMTATLMDWVIPRLRPSGAIGFIDFWAPRGVRRDIVAAAMVENGQYGDYETVHHLMSPEAWSEEITANTNAWITKYGEELNFVWICWDIGGIISAQAMAAAGYTDPNQMFTVGIDGGAQAWATIRDKKVPFVASLAQPLEYNVHMIFEVLKQHKIDGIEPGEPGALLDKTLNLDGTRFCKIVTAENVPDPGKTIYEVFDYFGEDPNNPNSWVNWGTPYTVTEFTE